MKQGLIILSVFFALTFCNKKQSQISGPDKTAEYSNSIEISIPVDSVTLYGTLTVPKGIAEPPVVIIITGSGPMDRDGNSPNAKTNIYKILADSLAKNGIASFRYDKRFIGKSIVKNIDESKLTFETYVNDAATVINWFKSQQQFSKIIVLGHSEGSLIGILAIQKTPVDKFISVAGAGRPIDQVLKEQLEQQPKIIRNNAFPIIDSLKQGKTVTNIPKILYSLFRPSVQPYLISWMKYDPTEEISKLNIPILIIQGTTDIQVSIQDAKLLKDANSNAKLVLIKQMNHVFRQAPLNKRSKNVKTYFKPDMPIMSEFVQEIVKFINT